MASNLQLKLKPSEMTRLGNRIQEDYLWSTADHQRRMERFRRYYQKFRNRVDPPALGDEGESNFSVPVVQWHTYERLAKEVGSLLGDDAEIIAKPTAPADEKAVKKIGIYMTWRMFQAMRITNPLIVFLFRKILFGRSHAYLPYEREMYEMLEDDGNVRDELWYEGPKFNALWPDDLIVPAEDADAIHDFSFCVRRYRATPDDLLAGEEQGLYQGVDENFQEILDFAQKLRRRENFGEEIKREKDEAEGVLFEGGMSARDALVVHEWYGGWRMLSGAADARETNLKRRKRRESGLVVRYLPEMNRVIGAQDLMDLYPKMRYRRPFVESSLTKDGSYWSPGVGELLESIEDEVSANHNLFTSAGELSVGPIVFYKPSSGFDIEKFKMQPGMAIECEDPAGIRVVTFTGSLEYAIQKEQAVLGYGERVDGVTDLSLGRSQDRPNAPRTATGTVAIINEGNVRVALDTEIMREDMSLVCGRCWELDSELAPESVFFRVTGEDADGLFDVKGGFGEMTAQERGGRYDFDIKFATSVYSREARKQSQLSLYQLDMQNPLIATNPKALWDVTNKIHAAFGDDNFADLLPAPPDLDAPRSPKEEWSMALRGEEFHVNPMDNDQLHLVDHMKRLTDEREDKQPDPEAARLMAHHIMEHQAQMRQKMLFQALTQRLAQSLGQAGQTPGLQPGGAPVATQQQQQQQPQPQAPGAPMPPGGQQQL
jgi:hypothetical protein